MQAQFPKVLNEQSAEGSTPTTLSETSLTGTANETSQSPEKKSLGQKIKTRIKNYFRNLNPRGKDKFWWTGNLLSTATTATLFVLAPAARPLKTLLSASLSVGLYATEKALERHRNNNWTEEQRTEYHNKRQEKFPNGVSRLKRFFLGVSAGGIYGAALGLPIEIANDPAGFHPIKNIERHIDALRK